MTQDWFAPETLPILETVAGETWLSRTHGLFNLRAQSLAAGRMHVTWLGPARRAVLVFDPGPHQLDGIGRIVTEELVVDRRWPKRHGGSALRLRSATDEAFHRLRFTWTTDAGAANALRLQARWNKKYSPREIQELLLDQEHETVTAKPMSVTVVAR